MKKINSNTKSLYIIIICFLFIKILSAINMIPMITNIIPIIWFIIFIIGIFITHSDYNHFYDKKDKIYTVIIILIIYLIIHFSLGLIFGFSYNVYQNDSLKYILKNVYIFILPIIFQEYIRGVLCNYSSNSNKIRFVISILFILINLNFNSLNSVFISGESFLKFLCLNLIPLISLELVLTYLTSIASYKISIIYKLIITIYSIFIPIVPNLNFFISGMINTSLPVIVYLIIDKYHELDISKVYQDHTKQNLLSYTPIMLIIVLIILGYSGVFKYGSIAILSNSMQPLYSKGDTIVYKKLNEEEKDNLNIGDIIVYYDKNENTIIHRIVNIQDNGIITKGDNNENNDNQIVKLSDIKGKYIFHIKYLGSIKMFMYEVLNG
ncbi:MAG: signal peptidase I [Firmicutes bacterium]|nr:signal peptidase I [Bacillota bacterium]